MRALSLLVTNVLVLTAALVLAAAASAQSATGTIHGAAVDQDGLPISGASVTIVNTATGTEQHVASDADGRFAAPALQVGPYEVTATFPSLAARRQEGIWVHGGRTVRLRLVLEAAALTDTIKLAPTLPVLEMSPGDVRSVVEAEVIANLPFNGRHLLDPALLAPGTLRSPATGDLHVPGLPARLNRLSIDGTDATNTFAGGALPVEGWSGPPPPVPLEAVQEISVDTNGGAAEHGRAGGVNLGVVTRSGSNAFGGSLFERYQPESRDRWQTGPGRYHRNQYGGHASGPIVRGRHFFFVSHEGQRGTVPRQARLHLPPAIPQDDGTGSGVAELERVAHPWDFARHQDLFFARSDHRLSSAHRLTLRYDQSESDGREVMGDSRVTSESAAAARLRTRAFMAASVSPMGPIVNEARVLIREDRRHLTAVTGDPQADIFQSGAQVVRIGGSAGLPAETTIDRLQLADTVTWVRDGHRARAGLDLVFDDILVNAAYGAGGRYRFDSIASFARGVPDGAGDQFTQAFPGESTGGFVTRPDLREYALFAQDDWTISPALTLQAGVRYDRQTFGGSGIRNPDSELARAGLETSTLNTDTNNWGPRIGAAWAPVDRSYVVRGGYGISYGRVPAGVAAAAYALNGVSVRTITLIGADGDPVPTYPERFAAVPSVSGGLAKTNLFVVDGDLANPRIQHASAGIEWEWMPKTSVAVSYLRTRAAGLPQLVELNVGGPVATTLTVAESGTTLPHYRFTPGAFDNFAQISAYRSAGESRIDALTMELHRRFSQGYSYRVAYTLGRAEDTAPDLGPIATNVFDGGFRAPSSSPLTADPAPSDDDQRHRLVASIVYPTDTLADRYDGVLESLLERWNLSFVFTIDSGHPYTAFVSGDADGDGNDFNDVAPGTGRNQFRLSNHARLDTRVARGFRLGGLRLTAMWEAFNLLDGSSATAVDQVMYSLRGATLVPNPLFGEATARKYPRTMQWGGRIEF